MVKPGHLAHTFYTCAVTDVRVVERNEWGARAPKRPYTALVDSKGIAVHHIGAGAKPPARYDQAVARAQQTQRYHMDAKGWNDGAYGFMVGAGCVFVMRGWGWVDGADTGPGKLMHSVCWMGDSDHYDPPQADIDAINWVLAEHGHRYPGAALHIVGHGDINQTSCPGAHLRRHLADGTVGLIPTSKPAAPPRSPHNMIDLVSLPDGRLVEFKAWWGTVVHRWQETPNGIWSPYAPLDVNPPPEAVDSVTAALNDDGRAEILAWGPSTLIYRKFQIEPGGAWSGWLPQ